MQKYKCHLRLCNFPVKNKIVLERHSLATGQFPFFYFQISSLENEIENRGFLFCPEEAEHVVVFISISVVTRLAKRRVATNVSLVHVNILVTEQKFHNCFVFQMDCFGQDREFSFF